MLCWISRMVTKRDRQYDPSTRQSVGWLRNHGRHANVVRVPNFSHSNNYESFDTSKSNFFYFFIFPILKKRCILQKSIDRFEFIVLDRKYFDYF